MLLICISYFDSKQNHITYYEVLFMCLIHFQQLYHGPPRMTSLSEQSVMESVRRLACSVALAVPLSSISCSSEQQTPIAFHKSS